MGKLRSVRKWSDVRRSSGRSPIESVTHPDNTSATINTYKVFIFSFPIGQTRRLNVTELHVIQRSIRAIDFQQFIMTALLDHATLFEN